jgi:hypothetical protein
MRTSSPILTIWQSFVQSTSGRAGVRLVAAAEANTEPFAAAVRSSVARDKFVHAAELLAEQAKQPDSGPEVIAHTVWRAALGRWSI